MKFYLRDDVWYFQYREGRSKEGIHNQSERTCMYYVCRMAKFLARPSIDLCAVVHLHS